MQSSNRRRKGLWQFALGCGALLLCLGGVPSTSHGDWLEDTDYEKLISALGGFAQAPAGVGVPISIVEAPPPDADEYFPDKNNHQFSAASDPQPPGVPKAAVIFADGSGGESNGNSNHATTQAFLMIGNIASAAPLANEITVYEANNFLDTVLNVNVSDVGGQDNTLPNSSKLNFRVQNFSWVGSYADANDGSPEPTVTELDNDREALRRFDFAINANNITAVVGLSNNLTELHNLLAHSYNAISVGRSSGKHSIDFTHFDYGAIGRSKPDLVAPQGSTSAATSVTSSAAIFLHSSPTVLGTSAAEPQAMKAILMAGATKDEFPGWSQLDGSGTWHPLDDTFGAGELNIYNSYLITEGGQTLGSTNGAAPVPTHGWDFQNVQPGSDLMYQITVPNGSVATELSILLTWNAVVSAPFNLGDPVVADLTLELLDSSEQIVEIGMVPGRPDGLSNSDVDNVEHLYLTDLGPGTYTLKVSSEDLSSDFGLAWRTATSYLDGAEFADFDEDGDVDGGDFLAWQRNAGTLLGATRADGDSNGDGDVDNDDLMVLQGAFAAAEALAFSRLTSTSVPEPATWFLLAVELLTLLALFRRTELRTA